MTKSVDANDFDAAFAEAIASAGSGEPSNKVTDDAAAADAAKAAADAAAAKAAADAANTGKTPEQIAAEADAATKKAAEEAARKLAEEAAAKLAAEKAAADKAAAEKAAEIKDPELTPEQQAQLTAFEKEWPDIAQAVNARNTHTIAQLEAKFGRALTAIVKQIYDDMRPMAESAATVETNLFRGEVLKAHPDYDTIAPKLPEWIAKQPAYLAKSYKEVYDGGSVQDFTHLVATFKKDSGIGSQASGTPAPSNTQDTQSAATAAAAKAAADKAAALAPVSGKRTTPAPQSQDANDFDGAFAEAAKLYAK